MSRPDWGALQQEYIAEYTRSGISPVAWCEARGLNYATARRYIEKLRKMRRKKCAKLRKKVREKKLRRLRKGRTENLRKKRLYPMHS
ncbi:terminase [Escherichia coli]|nr:terminase [Escherichia coli]EKF4585214.1 terminase [Escherichia coli O26]EKC4963603.1 terminase [Escherichia coli]EKF0381197.1 terminase [Escherichia coli]EKH3693135.1 terminase [Escherichia coli]